MALGDYFSVSLDELVGREAAEDYANMPQYDTEPMQPREWVRRWRFEYRSKREIHGLPLVHIHFGDRGICHAKGIVAIGNVATGVVALGTVAVGVISLGAVSAGLLALGAVALGTVTLGGLAVGMLVLGGLAVGYLAIGGCAIGIYTVGAAAIGARVAVGEAVKAPLALGREKVGGHSFTCGQPGSYDPAAISQDAPLDRGVAGIPGKAPSNRKRKDLKSDALTKVKTPGRTAIEEIAALLGAVYTMWKISMRKTQVRP